MRSYRQFVTLFFLFATCLVGKSAFSNPLPTVDKERVARAIGLTLASASAKMKNVRAIPHWVGTRDMFWYRHDATEGYDFILVDAASGNKRPAFDRATLATALSAASGAKEDPLHLPVTEISMPSGDQVLVKLTKADATYECGVDAASVCTKQAVVPVDPTLSISPDKRLAVLVRDNNLWLRNLQSGAETALTQDGAADNAYGVPPDPWAQRHIERERAGKPMPPFMVSWSPDSRRILVPHVDQRHVAPYPYIEDVPVDGSFRPKAHSVRMALAGERPAQTEWYVIDVQSNGKLKIDYPDQALLLDEASRNVLGTWWKADGHSFLQLALAWDMKSGYLFEVNALTGAVRTVVKETAGAGLGLNIFNAGGYGPTSVRILTGQREAILYSSRDGWGHFYLYDIAKGRLKNQITRGDWVARDIIRVDEKRRWLYFTASGRERGNPYHRYLYRIDLDGSNLRLLTPESGDHMLVDPTIGGRDMDGTLAFDPFSPSGDYFVYDVSSVDKPPESHIRRSSNASLVTTFERADVSALLAAGYHPPQEITVKAADGKTDLYGLVYRPSDFDPTKKYAVIDMQYGSPTVAVTPRSFATAATIPIDWFPPAATAEMGFIVVVVDARGTPYRAQSFSKVAPGFLADMGLADHVAFIRELARRDPSIDLTRVGISGVSFGGWTSIRALLAYPGFFKIGVAGAGPGTFYSMPTAPALTGAEGVAVYEGGVRERPSPTAVPANFASFDNVEQLGRMKGKLLMVVGEQDQNVVPGSSLQFYVAATEANKDVELLYVPNASHIGIYTAYVARRVWSMWLREFNDSTLPPDTLVPGMSPDLRSKKR